jgi:hypothetical protein
MKYPKDSPITNEILVAIGFLGESLVPSVNLTKKSKEIIKKP